MRSDTNEPKAAGDCGPCSPSMRNRYFRGKLLTVGDYQAEQRYMIQRRRMVNRATLGWGPVSGFGVARDEGRLTIRPGVALDRHGRELVLCESWSWNEVRDAVVLRPGKCGLEPSGEPPVAGGGYLLCVHYAEARIDGVRVDNGCGDAVCEPNHICETVWFSLRAADDNCPPFRVHGCDKLAPEPGQAAVAAEIPRTMPYVAPRRAWGPAAGRGNAGRTIDGCRDGPCRDDFDPCRIPKLDTVGDCDFDYDAGVPLIYVTIEEGDCGPAFGELTPIIGCSEPTAIKDIGWRNWHELPGLEIARGAFFAMFVPPSEVSAPPADTGGRDEDEDEDPPYRAPPAYPPVDTRFWVCFTAPVQIASLTPDVMTMSLAQADDREAVSNVVLVPIVRIWCAPTTEGDPPGTTRGFRPLVQHEFWRGEINKGVKSGFRRPTFVEIRIDACAIVDWNGHAIEGCSIGRSLPTGHGGGGGGGDFVSSWRVRKGGSQIPPTGPLAAAAPADTGATVAA